MYLIVKVPPHGAEEGTTRSISSEELVAADQTFRLLVADDSAVDRRLVTRILENEGYQVSSCADGLEALQCANAEVPDLILLDFEMPRLDGLRLCRILKSNPDFDQVPVLFLSAYEDLEHHVEGLDAGAVDFITKPFERLDVLARVRAHLRVRQLTRLLADAHRSLAIRNQQLDEDLRAAGEIQRSLLPSHELCFSELRTSWCFLPSDQVGGDLFQLHPLDDDRLAFYVLDVEGHGVPAAMVSASLSRSLDPRGGLAVHHFESARGKSQRVVPPASVVATLDKEYPVDRFGRNVTLCYGVIDLRRGELSFASAGHPPPILIRKGRAAEQLAAGGPLIGLGMGFEFPEESLKLAPGDRLFLFTDGIQELENEAGDPFGLERVVQVLSEGSAEPLDRACDDLVERGLAFAASQAPTDDLTVLALEYLGAGHAGAAVQ